MNNLKKGLAGASGSSLIKDQLKDLGLAASKSRGQNFLKDETQIKRIVDSILAQAGPTAALMEIGPGLGALTWPLIQAGRKVTAVELDKGLAENLGQAAQTLEPGQLTVWHRDVLSLTGEDLAGAEVAWPGQSGTSRLDHSNDFPSLGGSCKQSEASMFLCGNLPYNISSPVLLWFLNHRQYFSGAVFMLQKEMASRLTAQVGTKDYGRLTVALGLWFEVNYLLDVPPSAFHPRPQVDSAVIALKPVARDKEPDISPEVLGTFTAAAFAARRKTILNNLGAAYGRERAGAVLGQMGINPGLRPEVLPPLTLAALAGALQGQSR